jgi:hypothetical protein
MADNTQISLETDGDIVATDDIGGIKYQRMKIVLGADGVNDGDVSSTNPLPVSGTFYQATQPVSIATMPTTPVTGTFYQDVQPVSQPMAIPKHDKRVVDESGAPAVTTITYSLNSVDVATKTITVSGKKTTIAMTYV